MSRIGKQPIKVPSGVNIKLEGGLLTVSGPKGSLLRNTYNRVEVALEKGEAMVKPMAAVEGGAKYWGLYRTLLANMVEGVTTGFTRMLELQGTGYRASMSGKILNLTVGYSHPVNLDPPVGVAFDVDKAGKVVITGADKELVGQIAAKVRSIRPPEPYHGKGIRYLGEVIVTKVGKSAGKK